MDETLFQLIHGVMTLNEQVTEQKQRIAELEAQLAAAQKSRPVVAEPEPEPSA